MAARQFITTADLAAIAQTDADAVERLAAAKRLGFITDGMDGRTFTPEAAISMLDALQPHTYVTLSAAAGKMRRPPQDVRNALAQMYGDGLDAGYAPVLMGLGHDGQDALYPAVGMQRAWRQLDPAAETASRGNGRAFTSMDELANT